MRYLCIFNFLCFFLSFCLFSFSQSIIEQFSNYIPSRTELIETKKLAKEPIEVIEYKYKSSLSKEEIISFYKSLFGEFGFREAKKEEIEDTFFFTRGFIQQILLSIYEPIGTTKEPNRTYYITFWEVSDILGLSSLHFSKASSRSFIPVPPGVFEGFQVIEEKPTPVLNSHLYLSSSDFDSIKEFYLNEMPKNNWELRNTYSYRGRENFFYIGSNKELIKKIFSPLGINLEEFYPGIDIDIQQITLEYERPKESCVISIVEFLDSFDVLKDMHINPQPLKKYGKILIIVNKTDKSFEEMEKEAGKSFTPDKVKFLRNFLGRD